MPIKHSPYSANRQTPVRCHSSILIFVVLSRNPMYQSSSINVISPSCWPMSASSPGALIACNVTTIIALARVTKPAAAVTSWRGQWRIHRGVTISRHPLMPVSISSMSWRGSKLTRGRANKTMASTNNRCVAHDNLVFPNVVPSCLVGDNSLT